MARKEHKNIVLLLLVAILVVFIVACENPTSSDDVAIGDDPNAPEDGDDTDDGSGDDDGGTTQTVDPPDGLIGTIALDDGTSAVIDLDFTADASSTSIAGATVEAQAIYTVDGTVRYKGQDFTIAGSYNSETATITATASNNSFGTFSIEGTYDATNGFVGTVTFTNTDGIEVATGQVGAPGVADAERDSVTIYLGTYGGSTYGSWNGTVTSDRFYGTYQSSDERTYQGTFAADLSGSSVTGTATGVPFGGELNENDGFISGWYSGDYTEDNLTVNVSGTWSGSKVDASNDIPTIGTSSAAELIANLMIQTLTNVVRKAEGGIDYSNLTVGTNTADVSGIDGIESATFQYQQNPDGFTSFTIELATGGYTDDVTGVSLSTGQIYAEYDAAFVYSLLTSSALEVAGTVGDGPDDGVNVTFPDDSSAPVYVDGTINASDKVIGGTWEFPVGTDVSNIVEAIFF